MELPELVTAIRTWISREGLSVEAGLARLGSELLDEKVEMVELSEPTARPVLAFAARPGRSGGRSGSGVFSQSEEREKKRLTNLAMQGNLPPEGQARLCTLLDKTEVNRKGGTA